MLPRIIFFTAVSAATLAVILLALVSPTAHRKLHKDHTKPWVALSLYIQHPPLPNERQQTVPKAESALVFRHTLTDGPENRSRVIGKAQGFIIPVEHFANSAFNIIYLTFDTPEYSGSLSVEAKQVKNGGVEDLKVVGGTGSFAFARGSAVFVQMGSRTPDAEALYHVKLRLRFPDRSRTIPG